MNRRTFIRTGLETAGPLLALSTLLPSRGFGASEVDPPRSPHLLRFPATLQPGAFASGAGDDAQYHALVYAEGSAAGKALLTTPFPDLEAARTLRARGAQDGGGVPMSAWTLRRLPLVPQPNRRVQGSPVRMTVMWDGWEEPRELSSLLEDPGGRGLSLRFGGNEEQNHHWDSGCIVCLFSCPGGVVSNANYSIRDHVRGATSFSPASDLPPDETEVTVTLELAGSG